MYYKCVTVNKAESPGLEDACVFRVTLLILVKNKYCHSSLWKMVLIFLITSSLCLCRRFCSPHSLFQGELYQHLKYKAVSWSVCNTPLKNTLPWTQCLFLTYRYWKSHRGDRTAQQLPRLSSCGRQTARGNKLLGPETRAKPCCRASSVSTHGTFAAGKFRYDPGHMSRQSEYINHLLIVNNGFI